MIHLGCFGLIFTSIIQKILVDVIELGVWVKHSCFTKFLIIDNLSVIEEIVFLFEWKHAIDKLLIINFCQPLASQLKEPVKRQEILQHYLNHQDIFWFPCFWMRCPEQIELYWIPSQGINVVIYTLCVLFKNLSILITKSLSHLLCYSWYSNVPHHDISFKCFTTNNLW